MQFTYYFYAAVEDLRREQYAEAMTKLLFCQELCPEDGKTQDYLGVMYDALRDPEEAKEHFRRAYEAEPDELWQRYTAILLQGEADEQKQAVRILEQLVKRHPDNSEAWDRLRQAYATTGDYPKSIKAQDKLDKLRGYDAYSALHRYRCYVLMGKAKKAIAAIDQYLEQDPTNMQFLLFRLELLERTGAKWSELEQMYQRILQIDSQNALVLNNYAYGICTHGGDLKQAERMSEIAIRQQPENATYLDTYAWVLHLQGQDLLASFYIKKALDLCSEQDRAILEEHYRAICPPQPVQPTPPAQTWQHLRTYGKVTLRIGDQALEGRCVNRLTRDSMVTISLMAMGAIEIIRIEATPKNILVINKMDGKKETLKWNRLNTMLQPAPDWAELCRIAGQEYFEQGTQEFRLHYTVQGAEAELIIVYDKVKKE